MRLTLLLLALGSLAACTIQAGPSKHSDSDSNEPCKPGAGSVATRELSPHYDVKVQADGTAFVRASFGRANVLNNYKLDRCDVLVCNGERLGLTSDALIVLDPEYFAKIPAAADGASYRFELRRGNGEVVVDEIGAPRLSLAEPTASATLRRATGVRVAWSPATGDDEISIVMTVTSGRQAGAQITGKAVKGAGVAVLDGFDFAMSPGESFDVSIGARASSHANARAPFAGGDLDVEATSQVAVKLVP